MVATEGETSLINAFKKYLTTQEYTGYEFTFIRHKDNIIIQLLGKYIESDTGGHNMDILATANFLSTITDSEIKIQFITEYLRRYIT